MYRLTDILPEQYNLYVALLTETEKNSLIGQQYSSYAYFNPIQDIDNNWVISIEEINLCDNQEFMWIKDLPFILFKQKPNPELPV